MARLALAVAAVCFVASAASAQDGLRSASLPERTPAAPIPPERGDLFLARPGAYAPHPARRHPSSRHLGDGYLFGPPSVVDPYEWNRGARGRHDRPAVERADELPRSAAASAPAAHAEPPTPSRAPGVPKIFYVIPGCYAGDKAPRADQLRAGCMMSRMRVIPPTAD